VINRRKSMKNMSGIIIKIGLKLKDPNDYGASR